MGNGPYSALTAWEDKVGRHKKGPQTFMEEGRGPTSGDNRCRSRATLAGGCDTERD